MITRAARRRQNLRYFQNVAEQIQLPWLCPALRSSHTTYTRRSNHRPIASRPQIETTKSTAHLSTFPRKLASANTFSDFLNAAEPSNHFAFPSPTPKIHRLAPEVSQILMIDHSTATELEATSGRKGDRYIRGNVLEVEATLDACLQIHRWNQAFNVLTQLRELYQGDVAQLQRLYNKVLEAMVFDHIWNRATTNVAIINSWVEKTMDRAGVPPNAQTFALKIKAAMSTLQGRKRDRTVLRYWEMAKEYNVDVEVASMRAILSDGDLGKLSEISPLEVDTEWLENDAEEDEIAVQDDIVSQRASPVLLETEQKGLGMTSLRQSLSLFHESKHLNEWENLKTADPATREAYAERRQVQLEEDSLSSAVERWRQENRNLQKLGISGVVSGGKVGSLMWIWHQKLAERIESELTQIAAAEDMTKKREGDRLRTEYGPFLRLLEPERLAALTVLSTVSIMTKAGVGEPIKLSKLVTDLGRTVETEVREELSKREKVLRTNNGNKISSDSPNDANLPIYRESQDVHESIVPQRVFWTSAIHAKVGSILCELLLEVAKISVTRESPGNQTTRTFQEAAFTRMSTFNNGKRFGVVQMHEKLAELLVQEPVADVIAKQLPMVSKPMPWAGFRKGGYLHAVNEVLRIKGSDQLQKEYTVAASERGDLDELFKGLDVLGQTGWRVNRDLFLVMVDAWNTGEAIANLPPLEKVFSEVSRPAEDAPARDKFKYYREVRQINNERSGLHSNRCFQNFQMEIARAYLDETFYLPHNVDFRGRAYPIPPYLNQMGADNARALLLFADGRELGANGLRWLKIHLANVCGYDKANLADRASFADNHMDDIRDSVQNPLSGKRWWLTAEDPWQCLATCQELLKAIDSPDPQKFVSHLPIHQDGSCNGLQHYAALGGDIAGARQVNLEPGEKPADVYTGVCELVKAEIQKDAEAGSSIARLLDGRITRKIVKQTVMTNVYGVTFHGAMLQVKKQVDALLPDLAEQKMASEASMYIARKIFKGLGTLFEGAHDIQYWFGDCANRIAESISPAQLEQAVAGSHSQKSVTKTSKKSKSSKKPAMWERKSIEQADFRSTVVWTTPLKLPVVQPYRNLKIKSVKTHMAGLALMEPSITDSVDRRKQLQAFPPNFIHSLDATHMMLSALKANESGLTFSAVHDSFWTHAADVDTLSTLLRDAFIRMHSEDIVGRLAAEFQMRYKGHIYLARVEKKSPIAREILAHRSSRSGKKGSLTSAAPTNIQATGRRQYHELMEEYERQKLLASEDPIKRKQGEKMITPASIFEKSNGEQYLVSKNSLGETAASPRLDVLTEALSHEEEAEDHDVDLTSTLEPLLDEAFESSEEQRDTKTGKPKRVQRSTHVWVWLPMSFKDVPKRGEWDVKRLKESVYFFS